MLEPLRLLRATQPSLTRLDRKARGADLRVRCRVLLKVHASQSRHQVAGEIGCCPATTYRVVARFVVHGEDGLLDGRWSNGVRKVSPEVLGGIGEILLTTPNRYGFPRPTWTVAPMARVFAQGLGVPLTAATQSGEASIQDHDYA